jgi:adenine-specific DNA-methyltransferase
MTCLSAPRHCKHLNILDPGIGSGILSVALIERYAENCKELTSINLIGYETDSGLLPVSRKSLLHLKKWLLQKGIELTFEIRFKDFVLDKAYVLDSSPSLFSSLQEGQPEELFDVIISNPPYFKISKDDPRARAAARIVYGQPNIYALFMAISACLLNTNGELIFITPRSYTSGPYFRAFREFFFSEIIPIQFHLFGSRTNAFNRDAVLQENIIIYAKRNSQDHGKDQVTISFSHGSHDLHSCKKRKLPLRRVIDISSLNKVVNLPVTETEDHILSIVDSWHGSLHNYEMEISTGKVVPFRATKYLSAHGDIAHDEAPLIWMNSIRDFDVVWPFNKKSKPQYIHITDETMPLLNHNSNYILLRRFSAKEEQQRLNSSPFLKNKLPCQYVAFENHVNYIHRPAGRIFKSEAIGISAILNSGCLNTYFRVSNGNTQVSATEIRDLPLPDMSIIKHLGEVIESGKPVDVDKYLLTKSIN